MRQVQFFNDVAALRRRYSAGVKRLDAALSRIEAADDPADFFRARRAATASSGAVAVFAQELRDLLGPAEDAARHTATVSVDSAKAAKAAVAYAEAVATKASAYVSEEEVGRLRDRIEQLELEHAVLKRSTRVCMSLAGLGDETIEAAAILSEAAKAGPIELLLRHEQGELSRSVKLLESAGADLSSFSIWKQPPPKRRKHRPTLN